MKKLRQLWGAATLFIASLQLANAQTAAPLLNTFSMPDTTVDGRIPSQGWVWSILKSLLGRPNLNKEEWALANDLSRVLNDDYKLSMQADSFHIESRQGLVTATFSATDSTKKPEQYTVSIDLHGPTPSYVVQNSAGVALIPEAQETDEILDSLSPEDMREIWSSQVRIASELTVDSTSVTATGSKQIEHLLALIDSEVFSSLVPADADAISVSLWDNGSVKTNIGGNLQTRNDDNKPVIYNLRELLEINWIDTGPEDDWVDTLKTKKQEDNQTANRDITPVENNTVQATTITWKTHFQDITSLLEMIPDTMLKYEMIWRISAMLKKEWVSISSGDATIIVKWDSTVCKFKASGWFEGFNATVTLTNRTIEQAPYTPVPTESKDQFIDSLTTDTTEQKAVTILLDTLSAQGMDSVSIKNLDNWFFDIRDERSKTRTVIFVDGRTNFKYAVYGPVDANIILPNMSDFNSPELKWIASSLKLNTAIVL